MSPNGQLDRIERKVDITLRRVTALLRWQFFIARKLDAMATDLTEITATVTRTEDAEKSAVLLLQDLKAKLDAAGTDPVALKALSDSLGSSTDALAAAIVANTPAENPPTGGDTTAS